MSLDSLFQHILLTERQAQEQRRLIQEVKSETKICQRRINDVTENLKEARAVLETKVNLLSEKRFERILLEKRREILGSQKDALLTEDRDRRSALVCRVCSDQLKKEIEEEEENFLTEVVRFNNDYGLTSDRGVLVRERIQAETRLLREEEETLNKEIESLRGENVHFAALLQQRNAAKMELAELELHLKDMEDKLSDSIAITKQLEDEKFNISQKPQSDAEYSRLKKELESYKEEDLEDVHEALRAEIDFLQSVRSFIPRY
ncbi:coiled-coil domain-containing protein 172 [Spea bombifrons]|uniref:coiled-coil domain-containing protein 172 n=1 Tax=Spea bombifrons TaxID=233779 RepID=UPI00234B14C0|nr:coiled-coil domain-containing protein 172 [Spea bombifrons]